MSDDSIKVAVRIRPLVPNEIEKASQVVVEKSRNMPQVIIKSGRSKDTFTYDFVFAPDETQEMVYENAVKSMVFRLFDGFNVTILAYGQTGSGKTHTMGTAYNGILNDEIGVIPRAIADIFEKAESMSDAKIQITCSFIELYKEQLYDLLSSDVRAKSVVDIREDPNRGIVIPNLTEIAVRNSDETITCLLNGSAGRAVGATAMNASSSRSHAIFTISIDVVWNGDGGRSTKAKFHLVDLAGSERSKKTKATGERLKEGIKINQGLLALGNVIKALCANQASQNSGFVSYRDSKLTRLLQDSLGGNSLTLMIACVSPADLNLEESLSSLRYANSAKQIKNKPVVNEDPKMAEINRLNDVIMELRLELMAKGGGRRSICAVTNFEQFELEKEIGTLKLERKKFGQELESALCDIANMEHRGTLFDEFMTIVKNCKNNIDSMLSGQYKCETEPSPIGKILKDIVTQLEKGINIVERDSNMETTANYPIDEEMDCAGFKNRQQVYREQLKDLKFRLEMKEQIYVKATESVSSIHTSIAGDTIKEFEHKIDELEKEKEKLAAECLKMKDSTIENKIKKLEKEIAELKEKNKKMLSSTRVQEKQIKQFDVIKEEIQALKRNKVKLVQEMRADSQRFRTWKQQQAKEMLQLREKDRRREAEMKRKELLHNRQQNVLRRKVDEAVAVNKRLKDALDRQKNAQALRNAKPTNGKKDTIKPWLNQELEMIYSTVEAQHTISRLIEDRGIISKQLIAMKKKPLADKEEIIALQEDVDLRNAQIADMQEKIKSSNLDEQIQNAAQNVQNMQEGRAIIKHLFTTITELRNEFVKLDHRLRDVRSEQATEVKTLELKEEQHAKDIELLQEEKKQIENDFESKIAILLTELSKMERMNDSTATDRQKVELDTIEHLRLKVRKYEEEISVLKSQGGSRTKKPKIQINHEDEDEAESAMLSLSSEAEFDDNERADPDWQQTPMVRRKRETANLKVKKQNSIESNSSSNSQLNVERPSNKRSLQAHTCHCKTNCKKKNCGCKKNGNWCTESCKCSSDCRNLKQFDDESASYTSDKSSSADQNDENIDESNAHSTPKKMKLFHNDADCTTPYPYEKKKRKPLLDV